MKCQAHMPARSPLNSTVRPQAHGTTIVVSQVICPRHPGGSQPGILACSHVSPEPSTPSDTHPLRILVEDSEIQMRLVVLACPDCCSRFNLTASHPIPGDTFWNESSFPY